MVSKVVDLAALAPSCLHGAALHLEALEVWVVPAQLAALFLPAALAQLVELVQLALLSLLALLAAMVALVARVACRTLAAS